MNKKTINRIRVHDDDSCVIQVEAILIEKEDGLWKPACYIVGLTESFTCTLDNFFPAEWQLDYDKATVVALDMLRLVSDFYEGFPGPIKRYILKLKHLEQYADSYEHSDEEL